MSDAPVQIAVEGRTLVVSGPDHLLLDRQSRRFFGAVLGGDHADGRWLLALRSQRLEQLVLRVDAYLSGRGVASSKDQIADRELERALERSRSFQRTRASASDWKQGQTVVEEARLQAALDEFGWSP